MFNPNGGLQYQGRNANQYYQYFLPHNIKPTNCPIIDPTFAQSYVNMLAVQQWKSFIPQIPPPPPPLPKRPLNDFQTVQKLSVLNIKDDTPDEVKKWIKARINNFPTQKNIALKVQRQKGLSDIGVADKEDVSLLELKLRKKLKMVTSNKKKKTKQDKNTQKQEFDKDQKPLPPKSNEQNMHPSTSTDTKSTNSTQHNGANNNKEEQKNNNKQSNYFKYLRNDLLDHLLKTEETHECNILLQCFRYFVKEGLVK